MSELLIPAFHLNHQGRVLLDTPEFALTRGQILAVTGPSGAGKSLWLRSLFGWSSPKLASCLRPRDGAFLLVQDPGQGLTPGLSLAGHFAEVCPKSRRDEIMPLLEGLGLKGADLLKRAVHSFSGGERQRLMLALCLIQNPKVLVCDEPAASLDPESESRLWQILEPLRATGLTLIFVTHRIHLIEHYADQVLLLEQGQVRYQGSKLGFFNQPKTRLHEAILDQHQLRVAALMTPSTSMRSRNPLFELKNLTLSFADRIVFDGYQLSLDSGAWYWLMGPSGRGKTSLAKVIAGLLEPDHVEMFWQGEALAVRLEDRRRSERHLIQYVFQHGSLALNPARLVGAQLREAMTDSTELRLALQRLRLEHLDLERGPGAFSMGELQRFNLIRALAQKPRLVIGDELLSALDLGVRNQAIQWLDQYRQAHNACVLIIAHDTQGQHLAGQQQLQLLPESGLDR